jgi:PAS domain S-box-containing protein
MKQKKPYTAPRVVEYLPEEVPKWISDSFDDDSLCVAPTYTTVVDNDRRYVRVSNTFCELLGYKSEELIGKKFDEVSAPSMSDIPNGFSTFKTLGHMQGLWTLVNRSGQPILVRYEAWLRPDSLIESNIEIVDYVR